MATKLKSKFWCKLFGKHTEFVPGTRKGDVTEQGKPDQDEYWKWTKFRCSNCGNLV